MTTIPEPSADKNPYFITDSGAELVRLIEQERYFAKAWGGLLPEYPDEAAFLAPLHRVLDVACGSGAWACEMAQRYPHLEVVGFDIDARMIEYANTQARVGGLHNARFYVMNAANPLDFANNYFDLVNGRWMAAIGAAAWPNTLREIARITRPGGIIRLTESDNFGISNSPAFEKLSDLFLEAAKKGGLTFSSTGRQTPLLRRFLRDAGYQNIQMRPFVIDWSAGTEGHEPMFQDHKVLLRLTGPYLVKMGVTTPEDFEQLYRQAEIEMMAADFCALWYLLTIWGEKPEA